MTEPETKKRKIVNGFEVPATCEEEKLELAIRHAHPRDSLIIFAETIPDSDRHHLYFVRGETGFCSVSTFYSQFFEEFDSKQQTLRMVERDDFWVSARYSQYWHLGTQADPPAETAAKIKKMWDDNGELQSALGTAMHRRIEVFCNEPSRFIADADDLEDFIRLEVSQKIEAEQDADIEKPFAYFLELYKHIKSQNLTVFRTELMMFDDESKLSGCADVLFIDKQELTLENLEAWRNGTRKLRVHLGDWKRSKAISRNGYNKFGKLCCSGLPSANYYKYSLQLNLYRYLLEKNYGMIVESMTMYVFHPTNAEYLEFPIQDYQLLIRKMIEERIARGFADIE